MGVNSCAQDPCMFFLLLPSPQRWPPFRSKLRLPLRPIQWRFPAPMLRPSSPAVPASPPAMRRPTGSATRSKPVSNGTLGTGGHYLQGVARRWALTHGGSPGNTGPAEPSTRTCWPLLSTEVPLQVPMTAGMPYSRATKAACDPGPPASTTTAAARWNRGVHEGLV